MIRKLLTSALVLLPVFAAASVLDRPFDFTDDDYHANGVDPLKINGRRQAPSAPAVVDTPNFSFQRNVRMISTTTGYGASGASNNPLGLWIHVWVNYTDKAFNTADGQKALDDLARKNGLALDGTPIIRTTSEIDNLFSKGYATKLTTTDASRYAICPEIKDPRAGGIAPDAFATFNRLPDGSLLEPLLFNAFNSLKTTGDWPNSNP